MVSKVGEGIKEQTNYPFQFPLTFKSVKCWLLRCVQIRLADLSYVNFETFLWNFCNLPDWKRDVYIHHGTGSSLSIRRMHGAKDIISILALSMIFYQAKQRIHALSCSKDATSAGQLLARSADVRFQDLLVDSNADPDGLIWSIAIVEQTKLSNSVTWLVGTADYSQPWEEAV
jgi:hypothetical protein